jgi:hypothetical protein
VSVLFLLNSCPIYAGNCSDVYQYAQYCPQYGLEVYKVLRNIVVNRVFTIYQVANMVVYELPKVIQQLNAFNNNLVIICDILHLIVSVPHIDSKVAEGLTKQMGRSIYRLVIISLVHSKKEY